MKLLSTTEVNAVAGAGSYLNDLLNNGGWVWTGPHPIDPIELDPPFYIIEPHLPEPIPEV